MAESFLTHTNRVIARLNEVALTSSTFSSARGIQIQFKNAVNEAIRYINQKEFQYPFNHSTKSQTLTAGTFKYSVPSDTKTVDYNTFRLVKDSDLGTSGGRLRILNYNDYLNSYITQEDEINTTNLKNEEYNNKTGKILFFNQNNNRYIIELDNDKKISVKEDNCFEVEKTIENVD